MKKNLFLTAALGLSLLTACEEDSGSSPGNNNNAGMLPAGVSGQTLNMEITFEGNDAP